jgi:hypothetical protein
MGPWFSASALAAPAWILLGSGFGIVGRWKDMTGGELTVWMLGTVLVGGLAWNSGAQQARDWNEIKQALVPASRVAHVQPPTSAAAAVAVINELKDKVLRLQPRHLSTDEMSKLNKAANKRCPLAIPVTAANANQEAQAYGWEFVNAFKGAGCNSDLALPIPGLTPNVQGLYVGVHDMQISHQKPSQWDKSCLPRIFLSIIRV